MADDDVISPLDLSDDVTMTFRFCSSNTIRVKTDNNKKEEKEERERVQDPVQVRETELNTFLFTAVQLVRCK